MNILIVPIEGYTRMSPYIIWTGTRTWYAYTSVKAAAVAADSETTSTIFFFLEKIKKSLTEKDVSWPQRVNGIFTAVCG